ncbi:YbhN family protein [Chloroflexota bacterium]
MSGSSIRSGSQLTPVRVLGTLIALSLLVYLLSQQGWDKIALAIHQIPPWRIGLALGLMSLSRLIISGRWYVLLRSTEIGISYWGSLRLTLAGLFATNFLPTTIGGDVVRLAGLIQLKYDGAVSTASLIVDRLVGLAGMAMAIPLGLPSLINAWPFTTTTIGRPIVMGTIVSKQWGQSLWKKIRRLTQRIVDALTIWLKKPRALIVSLALSWAHMLCFFLLISVLLEGMGEDIPVWTIAGLYSFAYFVTLLPFSINGYGLQEISLTFVFSSIGGATVSNSLTMALLFRTLTMLVSLPGAFFLPDILSPQKQSPDEIQTIRGETKTFPHSQEVRDEPE